MGVRCRGKDDITDSVGLLISILVRHPEVSTIIFDPDQQVLKFNFIVSGILDDPGMEAITSQLLDSIEVFNKLEGKYTRISQVERKECGSYTMVEIHRDVETLVREEISLIVALFRQCLENTLVADDNSHLFEEDIQMQEEIIEHMLESVKGYAGDKKLFAFREEGRVLVFNK